MVNFQIDRTPSKLEVLRAQREFEQNKIRKQKQQKAEQKEQEKAKKAEAKKRAEDQKAAEKSANSEAKKIKIVNKGGVFFEESDIVKNSEYKYVNDQGITIWNLELTNGQRVSYPDRSKDKSLKNSRIRPSVDAENIFSQGKFIHKISVTNVDGISIQGVKDETDQIDIYYSDNVYVNGNGGNDKYTNVHEKSYDDNTYRMHTGDTLDLITRYYYSNAIDTERHYEYNNYGEKNFVNNSETEMQNIKIQKAQAELEERIRQRSNADGK